MMQCNETTLQLHGRISFDYSTHNGLCEVGIDNFRFGIKFIKSTAKDIYVSKDDPFIQKMTLVRSAQAGELISFGDYATTDFPARVDVGMGEGFLMENTRGYYLQGYIESVVASGRRLADTGSFSALEEWEDDDDGSVLNDDDGAAPPDEKQNHGDDDGEDDDEREYDDDGDRNRGFNVVFSYEINSQHGNQVFHALPLPPGITYSPAPSPTESPLVDGGMFTTTPTAAPSDNPTLFPTVAPTTAVDLSGSGNSSTIIVVPNTLWMWVAIIAILVLLCLSVKNCFSILATMRNREGQSASNPYSRVQSDDSDGLDVEMRTVPPRRPPIAPHYVEDEEFGLPAEPVEAIAVPVTATMAQQALSARLPPPPIKGGPRS